MTKPRKTRATPAATLSTTFSLSEIVYRMLDNQVDTLSHGEILYLCSTVFFPAIRGNYGWLKNKAGLVRTTLHQTDEIDDEEDEFQEDLLLTQQKIQYSSAKTLFQNEVYQYAISELWAFFGKTSCDSSGEYANQDQASQSKNMQSKTVWQQAWDSVRGKLDKPDDDELDLAESDKQLAHYLRKSAERFIDAFLGGKTVARQIYVKIRDDVLDDAFEQMDSANKQSAWFRPAGCDPAWKCWQGCIADSIETISFPPLKGRYGKTHSIPLPTPTNLADVIRSFMQINQCGLTIEQMKDLALTGWNLKEPRPVSLDEPDDDAREDGVEYAGIETGPMGSTVTHSQAYIELPNLLIKAIEKADKRQIPDPPELPKGMLASLMLQFLLWQGFPLTEPGTGKYGIKEYSALVKKPVSTLNDRCNQKLLPLLKEFVVQHGTASIDGVDEMRSVFKKLRDKFYHCKPEFVADTDFYQDEGETNQQ